MGDIFKKSTSSLLDTARQKAPSKPEAAAATPELKVASIKAVDTERFSSKSEAGPGELLGRVTIFILTLYDWIDTDCGHVHTA
jgi:hypothetical protein